jgi:hypothetical protein
MFWHLFWANFRTKKYIVQEKIEYKSQIYQSKTQGDLVVVQYSNGVSCVLTRLKSLLIELLNTTGITHPKIPKRNSKSLSPISLSFPQTEHFRLHVTTDCARTCLCICVSKASVIRLNVKS